MDSPSIPKSYGKSLLSLTPPDMSDSSRFTAPPDLDDLSLSDLQGPSKPIPTIPRPRFSLFAPRITENASENCDESSLGADDEAEDENGSFRDGSSASQRDDDFHPPLSQDSDASGPQSTPKPRAKTRTSQPKGKDKEKQTPSTVLGKVPPPLTEEERLRRQLFDMQKINAAFDEYYNALLMVRNRQKTLSSKVDQTQQLLDRYVTILGQTEHNARLLLDPSWEGAESDAQRISEIKRAEEDALRAEQEAILRREEEARAQREAEERRAEEKAQALAARGRGGARGTRARAPSVRGVRGQAAIVSSRTPTSSTISRTASSAGSAGRGRGSSIPSIRPPSTAGTRPPSAAGRAAPRGVGRGIGRG